jgi:hypothetical protein
MVRLTNRIDTFSLVMVTASLTAVPPELLHSDGNRLTQPFDRMVQVVTHFDRHRVAGGIIRWLGLFLRNLFSTDHKVIGLLYGFTSPVLPSGGLRPRGHHAMAAGLSGPDRAGDL